MMKEVELEEQDGSFLVPMSGECVSFDPDSNLCLVTNPDDLTVEVTSWKKVEPNSLKVVFAKM